MAKKEQVSCKICKEKLFKDDNDCFRVGERTYYHMSCYKKQKEDEDTRNDIHEYCKHLYGVNYSKQRITRQINELVSKGRSLKGILSTLHYWYDIKNGDIEKSHGGIGIVDYVYDECERWANERNKNKNLNIDIDISDYLPKEKKEVVIERQPFKKPIHFKMFDIG